MNIEPNSEYEVEVIRIVKSGVIVKLEDSSTELIHISNLSNRFVSKIEDVVSVGDKLKAYGKADRDKCFLTLVSPNSKFEKKVKTLDEMISEMEKIHQDKMRDINKRNRVRSIKRGR